MHILKTRIHFLKSLHRRGFFCALTFIGLGTLSPLWATTSANSTYTRHITILDSQGQPVPYVSIINTSTNNWLMSDEQGHFPLALTRLDGDSLFIQRIGFKDRSVSLKDVLRDGYISLHPDILEGEMLQVFGQRGPVPGLEIMTQYSKSLGAGLQDHQQLFQRIPGLSVRSYGGPAGISTMSMDGGPSSHTKVLVDEIDITSAQNGEADLSQLPLPFIESMSYIPYDISRGGIGDVDGQIRLSSEGNNNHLSLSSGSYGHRAFDVGLAKTLAGFQTYLQLGQRHETADYPFVWSNHEGLRKNNELEQIFAAFSANTLIRSGLYLKMTGLESHQSRGAAGLVWSPDTVSHRNDMLRLLGSKLGWIQSNGSTHFQATWRQSKENYKNPYLALDSDHALKSLQFGIRDRRSLHPQLTLITDLNWQRDEIVSSEVQHHERDALDGSITAELQLGDMITLTPSLKTLFSQDLYYESFSDMQVSLTLPGYLLENLSASLGHIFNYPSFNDLYWEPGGNSALVPERTTVKTLQSRIDLRLLGDLTLQWQSKDSEDLIQWMPVHSYWQPSNVQTATRESRKVVWQLELPQQALTLYAHYSQIRTRDETLGKRLRYAPNATAAFNLSWSPGPAALQLNHYYVSDRISMYSWPEDIILEANTLWSASLGWTWTPDPMNLTLVLAGDNLTDLRYESIRGYPEPGRSYRLTATLGF